MRNTPPKKSRRHVFGRDSEKCEEVGSTEFMKICVTGGCGLVEGSPGKSPRGGEISVEPKRRQSLP